MEHLILAAVWALVAIINCYSAITQSSIICAMTTIMAMILVVVYSFRAGHEAAIKEMK